MSRLNHSGADVENFVLIIQGYEPQNDESTTRFCAGHSGLVVMGGEGEERRKASSFQVREERAFMIILKHRDL